MNKFKFKNVKMKYQSTLRKNTNICLTSLTRAKPKEKMAFPA